MRMQIWATLGACGLLAACNTAGDSSSFDGCDGLRGASLNRCLRLAALPSPVVSLRGPAGSPPAAPGPSRGPPGGPGAPGGNCSP